ncbi:MAG: TIM44-like domain-containing protein [Actinobacteria bacterium]|nr:TIM44-like domain-containing protein [Actinomycetota bacterium]
MRTTLRTAGTAAFAALILLLTAAPGALARGGGGTSAFGRGFGGGGGFGRAFGHGHFFFIPIGGGGGGLITFLIIAFVVFYLLPRVMMWWRRRQSSGTASRRKVAERQRRVELAAAEAAEDDPAFAPDVVRAAAAQLFVDIQQAWDADDRFRLRALVAPELLSEWERRLDDFQRRGWRNRVRVVAGPQVDYVGLRHTGDERGDRVKVRIEAAVEDYAEGRWGRRIGRLDSTSDTTRVREYWTLGKRENHWILLSIEQGAEGEHALSEEIVASPWSDEQRMRDEALVEGAAADAVPEGTSIAEVADLDFPGDARAAALDLSLADGRFAPDILEVAARRAVDAWAEAVDGDDAALLAIAHPEAARQLLHPAGSQTRLVVRGPRVKQIRILALNAAAGPPTMTIEVDLEGRRYLEDRDTAAVVAGSQSHVSSFTERWRLALDGGAAQPWRIAAVEGALAQI